MTSFNLEKYDRKSLTVTAVRITLDNIEEVANWCGGEIRENSHGLKYIHVNFKFTHSERQTRAYIGDWVTMSGKNLRFYSNKSFTKTFDRSQGSQKTAIEVPPKPTGSFHQSLQVEPSDSENASRIGKADEEAVRKEAKRLLLEKIIDM